jgi:hypothetical protein
MTAPQPLTKDFFIFSLSDRMGFGSHWQETSLKAGLRGLEASLARRSGTRLPLARGQVFSASTGRLLFVVTKGNNGRVERWRAR